MFRRLEAGLPQDPVFPVGLDALGYYINEIDEIRSKEDPKAYFHYFFTKNVRYNDLQREAMNESLRQVVLDRLADLGLETVRLPLTAGPEDPHIPILVSSNLKSKSRVVVVFADHIQDLGIFAYRIVQGPKGVNAGSAVDLVKYLQSQVSGPNDSKAPGVILANTGQLRWWRKGKKAISQASWYAIPQKDCVSNSVQFDLVKNTVPGNRTTTEHVNYVMSAVVEEFVNPKATIDVITVADSCDQIVEFLNDKNNWAKIGERLGGLALLSPYFRSADVTNEEFADYLKRRGRAFIPSDLEAGMPVCGPEGTKRQQGFGAPTYSCGANLITECILPLGYKLFLDWFLEVSNAGEGYSNPEVYQYQFGGDDDDDSEDNAEAYVDDDDDTWKPAAEIDGGDDKDA